jgi:hypothetical protein
MQLPCPGVSAYLTLIQLSCKIRVLRVERRTALAVHKALSMTFARSSPRAWTCLCGSAVASVEDRVDCYRTICVRLPYAVGFT